MKELILAYGPFVIIALLSISTMLLAKFGKDGIVSRTAKIIVEKVSEHYAGLDNTAKLEKAVSLTYNILPSWVKWIVTQKQLEKIVQKSYDELKDYIKNKNNNSEGLSKHIAMIAVNQTIREAQKMSVGGDVGLCNNNQLESLGMKSEEKINQLIAEIKYKTNFKTEKELVTELGFKKYF